MHTANDAKLGNDSKNNKFTVKNHHLPQNNGVMVHKNNNTDINIIPISKDKNVK